MGVTKMGCGCNRGGNAVVGAVQAAESIMRQARVAPEQSSDLVKIKVVAPDITNVRYVGRPTGTAYVFASVGPRSEQYVHRTDAEFFTNNFGHIFRYADQVPVGVAN